MPRRFRPPLNARHFLPSGTTSSRVLIAAPVLGLPRGLGCTRQPRPPLSSRGCSERGPVVFLPRSCCLCLILLCTCPPLHIGVWILLQRSFLGCRLRCAPASCSPRTRLCWCAFPCLPGPPSVRGCSASELSSILPRRTRLRLILFCTCPTLCAGALWPMPAWVWRDVRFFFLSFF